ncbi:MAG: hypothetical protein WAN36_08765 [Calditrichia bacterium]
MKMLRILLFSFLLFLTSSLWAQSYPFFPIGRYWHFPDARSLSMGGAGSVSLNTPGAMFYNPAALVQIPATAAAQLSLSGHKLDERRSYPLYDRFDGIIGKGVYAINNNWYFQPQGAIAVQLPGNVLPNLTLAAGSFTEIDQNYQYTEEVRQNIFGDSLLAYNRIQIDGSLRRYGIAVAAEMPNLPALSLGIQAGILDGSLDYDREIDWVRRDSSEIQAQTRRSLDNTPLVLSFGGIYRIHPRLSAGLSASLPYTVKYVDKEKGANEEIGYPMQLTAAMEYRPQQELKARLNVDFTYEFWSGVEYKSNLAGNISSADNFSDAFVLKAGIEHIFFNHLPFRVGMQYRNSFREVGNTAKFSQTLLSAGTGFSSANWQVEVAGAFSSATYRWPDLFDDAQFGGDRSASLIDDVDNSFFFGRLTLSYYFGGE